MTEETAADFDPRHKGKRHPNIRPKPAASLILVKRTGPAPRYLLGRRAETLAFLPRYFVFPGGRLERQDRNDLGVSPFLGNKIGSQANRFAACALRELTEETGLVLPPTARLSYVARAITPPGHIRRYDTRFLVCVVGDDFGSTQEIAPKDNELNMIGWFTRDEIEPDKLHRITSLVLNLVEECLLEGPRIENSNRPIPCFRFRHGKAVVEYD